jgi:L,D-transpeptidase YcbB
MHKSIMIVAMALAVATPAVAQVGPTPLLKPAATRAPAQAPASRVSQSPLPTLDEGTVERIAGAMLSLSALEVQGGWPTLPPSISKLAPGARGPDVALLRARLAITEDIPAALAEGDAYDDALAAAVRRFQVRHGLPETGSVGAKTLRRSTCRSANACASSRPRSIDSSPWTSISANATWW